MLAVLSLCMFVVVINRNRKGMKLVEMEGVIHLVFHTSRKQNCIVHSNH
jgi:hypothetical protein